MNCQSLEGFNLSAKRNGFCAAASAADAQVAEPITNKEKIRVRRFTESPYRQHPWRGRPDVMIDVNAGYRVT
jgi:hypothetical protein